MKLLPAAVLLALAALSCGKPSLPQPSIPLSGKDYFPIAPGNRWVYASHLVFGGSPEDRQRKFVVSKDGDGNLLIDEEGKGLLNSITLAYAITADGVTTKLGMFGVAKTEFTPPLVELPASIPSRHTWTWTGTSKATPMSITSVLEGMEKLTVPAGTFTCARIKRTVGAGITILHWYAEKVGLVKAEVVRPGASETLQLASYSVK